MYWRKAIVLCLVAVSCFAQYGSLKDLRYGRLPYGRQVAVSETVPEEVDDGISYFAAVNGYTGYGEVVTFSVDTSGAISDAVIDTYVFSSSIYNTEKQVTITHKAGTNFYVLGWCSTTGDYHIEIIEISTTGEIAASATDDFIVKTAVIYPDVMQLDASDYFLFACNTTAMTETFVKTLEISDLGVINKTAIDSLSLVNADYAPALTRLGNDYYIVTAWGAGTDGYLSTFSASSTDGTISNTTADAYEFQPWNYYSSGGGIQIGETEYFAFASRAVSRNFWTFEIDTLTGDVVDDTPITYAFSTPVYKARGFAQTESDTVLFQIYSDLEDDGWVRTFEVDPSDGSAASYVTAIDSLEIENVQGDPFHALKTTLDQVTLVGGQGGGSDLDGYIYSFKVDGAGDITSVDNLEFNTNSCTGVKIIELPE